MTFAQLSSAIVENEGSLSRALFKLAHFASAGVPAVAIPQKENVNSLNTHDNVDCARDTYQAYCPICMNDDETILYAPCGHAACRMDWVGLVQVALQDSSTTKVKKGEDGLLDVSRLQCHGCTCVSTVQVTESVCLTSSAQLLIGPHGPLPLTFFHSSRVPFCHATNCRLPLQGQPSIHKLNYNSPPPNQKITSVAFHQPPSSTLQPLMSRAGPRVQIHARCAARRPVQVRRCHRRHRAGRRVHLCVR
jgi:hypothetical protein